MGMKVRAKRMGYYGVARIREGEVFEIKDEQELGSWMEKVESDHPADIDAETGEVKTPRKKKW